MTKNITKYSNTDLRKMFVNCWMTHWVPFFSSVYHWNWQHCGLILSLLLTLKNGFAFEISNESFILRRWHALEFWRVINFSDQRKLGNPNFLDTEVHVSFHGLIKHNKLSCFRLLKCGTQQHCRSVFSTLSRC